MEGSDTEYLVIVNTSNCVQKFLYPDGDVVYSNYGEIVRGEISPYEAVVIKKGDLFFASLFIKVSKLIEVSKDFSFLKRQIIAKINSILAVIR